MSGIFVRELELLARVGVKPDEMQREQKLSLDIEVTYPAVALAADSGRLRDTLDYRDVAHTARRVVGRGHFRLVETLAVELARAILERSQADSVRVRIHKLDCLPGAAAAGVEVALGRDAILREPKSIGRSGVLEPEPLVVVGGGAAGLSAALWCWRLGHSALVVDPGPRLGGQLHLVHFRMPDLPGIDAMSGHALARQLVRQFVGHRGRWLRGHLVSIEPGPQLKLVLRTPDDERLELHALSAILAMGLRRRALEVPGESELRGKGILETASCHIRHLSGVHVAVIGGGDAACENALKLARAGSQVTLAFRRAHLSARESFRRRVISSPRIALMPNAEVAEFLGSDSLQAVRFQDGRELRAQSALVRIGWLPNSEPIPPEWRDARGYIPCDSSLRLAAEPRVFVAGDLRNPPAPSFACATGDGACAAKAASDWLEHELHSPPATLY